MKNRWQTKKLSEVATVQSGSGFPVEYQGKANNRFPFYKVSDMSIAGNELLMTNENNSVTEEVRRQLGAYVFPAGSVIFPKIGGAIATNKKRLTTRDCCIDNNLMGVVPRGSQIDSRFLYYFFLEHNLSEFANEAHLPSIKKTVIENCPVRLPIALAEQQRIVAILDKAFDGIATAKANTEKNLQNARALFENHIESIFANDDSPYPAQRLEDMCEDVTVGHVGPMAKRYQEKGIPFLRSQNIRPFEVSLQNLVFIDQKFHDSLKKSKLQPGDLAVVRTGYPGTAAVIPETLPDSNCSDIVIVRPGSRVDPNYLAAFFNSATGKARVAGRLVGAAQRHFNVAAAKHVSIPLPPLDCQRKIVSRLNEFRRETQRLESIYRSKLAKLYDLKQSFLNNAFAGEL